MDLSRIRDGLDAGWMALAAVLSWLPNPITITDKPVAPAHLVRDVMGIRMDVGSQPTTADVRTMVDQIVLSWMTAAYLAARLRQSDDFGDPAWRVLQEDMFTYALSQIHGRVPMLHLLLVGIAEDPGMFGNEGEDLT